MVGTAPKSMPLNRGSDWRVTKIMNLMCFVFFWSDVLLQVLGTSGVASYCFLSQLVLLHDTGSRHNQDSLHFRYHTHTHTHDHYFDLIIPIPYHCTCVVSSFLFPCSQTSPSWSINTLFCCSLWWAGSCGPSWSTASIALSFTWNHQPITTTSSHFTSSCTDNTTRYTRQRSALHPVVPWWRWTFALFFFFFFTSQWNNSSVTMLTYLLSLSLRSTAPGWSSLQAWPP